MEKKKLRLELGWADLNKAQSYDNGTAKAAFRDPHWAFARENKRQKTIETANDLVYCRESLCEYLRQDIRGISNRDIDKNKLRLVAHRRIPATKKTLKLNTKTFHRQILAGQKIVNVIEKSNGWPLTRIYPLQTVQEVDYNNIYYYIVASKRWMKSPHMLSLYTLLYRVALNEKKFNFVGRAKTDKSLKSVFDEVAANCSYTEAAYLRTHQHRWWLVLSNYEKLFGKRTMEDLYNPSDGGYLFQEGINSLCDLDTNDKKLARAFRKVIKNENSKSD
jgi:hypothetical protein